MTNAITAHFHKQAEACEKMGSPFTAVLCRNLIAILDRSTATGRTVLDWPDDPAAAALALRLCGGLHALVLDENDEQLAQCYPPDPDIDSLARILPGVIGRNDARLCASLGNAPQTNEIARAAALLPGLREIARQCRLPLALHEIGASAGLNLLADHFAYRYDRVSLGDPDSAVRISPAMRGGMPDPRGNFRIIRRSGCDIAPLQIGDPEDRLRLRSYIWPDQPERMQRLDAAIAIAEQTPFDLIAADAADYVDQSLANRKLDECHVLFHSVMWQYLPDPTKARIEAALEQVSNIATRDAPVAWLRMEGLGGVEPYATLQLTLWPGGEKQILARCDWHCRWIEWLAG